MGIFSAPFSHTSGDTMSNENKDKNFNETTRNPNSPGSHPFPHGYGTPAASEFPPAPAPVTQPRFAPLVPHLYPNQVTPQYYGQGYPGPPSGTSPFYNSNFGAFAPPMQPGPQGFPYTLSNRPYLCQGGYAVPQPQNVPSQGEQACAGSSLTGNIGLQTLGHGK